MKFLVVLCALVAVACSAPADNFVHVHQDTNGNYKVSYNADDIVRTEEGNNGEVFGTYSYIDADGHTQTIKYTAGVGGFVAEGTNLPVPEPENPEVVKARQDHLTTYHEVLKTLPITEEFYYKEPVNTVNVVSHPRGGLVPVIRYVPQEVALKF